MNNSGVSGHEVQEQGSLQDVTAMKDQPVYKIN